MSFHTIWGILLLVSADPLQTTPLGYSPLHVHWQAGMLYLVATIMAVFAMMARNRNKFGLVLILPQFYLVISSALTAVTCVFNNAYFDGVPRPWAFILADQMPSIMIFCFYSLALLDWFVLSRRYEV